MNVYIPVQEGCDLDQLGGFQSLGGAKLCFSSSNSSRLSVTWPCSKKIVLLLDDQSQKSLLFPTFIISFNAVCCTYSGNFTC